ncbi:hypothetical protein [Timonella senegalensis]|nr:hypothetical protein [Timonella senegalensis]
MPTPLQYASRYAMAHQVCASSKEAQRGDAWDHELESCGSKFV